MSEPDAPEFYDEGSPLSVLTAEPLGRALDYLAPEGGCWLGAFVEVPLGPRRVVGVVWGEADGNFPRNKLRAVNRVLEAAPMRAELRDFLTRVADYTLTPLPAMLRLATRVPDLGQGPALRKLLYLGDTLPPRMTDARQKLLAVFEDFGGAGLTPGEAAAQKASTLPVSS